MHTAQLQNTKGNCEQRERETTALPMVWKESACYMFSQCQQQCQHEQVSNLYTCRNIINHPLTFAHLPEDHRQVPQRLFVLRLYRENTRTLQNLRGGQIENLSRGHKDWIDQLQVYSEILAFFFLNSSNLYYNIGVEYRKAAFLCMGVIHTFQNVLFFKNQFMS